ncbi:putative phytanoyl- dioxygenase [Rosellinia necatrix]|uniref:Putative phytanoyl-dioxygenase n=1 Tax=Rosellinia necatrix TaxID=77044 RepID=A0A1S8A5K7_ROSNE|nr:putative phytanoyl- dioxygenase [Rosellinia necatrix]
MIEDAAVLQARGKDGPFNYNTGNIQQDAPPYAEYFHPSIFTNPIATQITSSVLGPRPKWTFCSGNTAVPPSPNDPPQRQPVHADADFAYPEHPFALVINTPLVDMTPHNGSTEVWLGTHMSTGSIEAQEGAHGERASGRIRDGILAKWVAAHGPPVQPNIKKGSIVIRDLRLWHAGMPNMSREVRVMLAQIHFASWYRNPMKLEFAEDIKPILEGLESQGELGLEIPILWVSKQQAIGGYLNRAFGNAYTFDQVV